MVFELIILSRRDFSCLEKPNISRSRPFSIKPPFQTNLRPQLGPKNRVILNSSCGLITLVVGSWFNQLASFIHEGLVPTTHCLFGATVAGLGSISRPRIALTSNSGYDSSESDSFPILESRFLGERRQPRNCRVLLYAKHASDSEFQNVHAPRGVRPRREASSQTSDKLVLLCHKPQRPSYLQKPVVILPKRDTLSLAFAIRVSIGKNIARNAVLFG